MELNAKANSKDQVDFEMRSNDVLLKCDRLSMPSDKIETVIMEEVHNSVCAM